MNDTNTSSQAGATPDQPAVISESEFQGDSSLSTILSMECIQPNPYQTRLIFPEQELQQLATSIAEIGLLEPIAVRKISDFSYQLIAGERRFRAFKLLNKTEIPCLIFSCTDTDMAIMALAENISRQDLSDYEIAKAIHKVEDLVPGRANLAESLGMCREDLYRYLAFDALPDFLIEKLEANPRLLSRTAATDIKSVLSKTTPENQALALSALKEALALLEAGELDQTKVADFIEQKLKQPGEAESARKEALFIQGKQVGYFLISSKGVSVHISPGVLSDERAEALKAWLCNFLNEPEP